MSDIKQPSPEFMKLVAKHSNPERVKALHPEEWTAANQERVETQWSALIAEAESLKDGDPGSPEALDLAERWSALVGEFTRGDPELTASTAAIYREALADPELHPHLPFSPAVGRFMNAACERLKSPRGGHPEAPV